MFTIPEWLTKIGSHIGLVIFIILYPLIYFCVIVNLIYCRYIRSYNDVIRRGDVAVITGAGHGLGKAYAEVLAEKGCNICVVDINGTLAEQVAKQLTSKFKVKAKAYVTDVSKYDQIEKLYKQVKEDFGTTTILINNAGVLTQTEYFDIIPEEILRIVNVNYVSNFWTIKLFLPDMKKQNRGRILATASMAGFLPLPFNQAYSSSKFAVRGLMRTVRLNLIIEGLKNIKATTVCPYFLKTNEKIEDLCSFFAVKRTYPLISGQEIAEKGIEAMVSGESEIIIPSMFACFYKFVEFLPSEIYDQVFRLLYAFSGLTYDRMKELQSIWRNEQNSEKVSPLANT